MKIQFDSEDGRRIEAEPVQSVPAHEAPAVYSPSFESEAAKARVESLVLGALTGTLPRERALEPYEAKKLRPRHIAILMGIAAGMTVAEASEKYRMTTVRINTILQHPDAIRILAALQSQAADKLSDVGARLQAYANEMLTTQVEIVRTTKNEGLKAKIAGEMLDRAGYGPKHKLEIDKTNRFVMPASVAVGLRDALRESDRIATVDYKQFTGKKLSAEQQYLESGAGVSSRPEFGTENPEPVAVSASPAASPEHLQGRKIA